MRAAYDAALPRVFASRAGPLDIDLAALEAQAKADARAHPRPPTARLPPKPTRIYKGRTRALLVAAAVLEAVAALAIVRHPDTWPYALGAHAMAASLAVTAARLLRHETPSPAGLRLTALLLAALGPLALVGAPFTLLLTRLFQRSPQEADADRLDRLNGDLDPSPYDAEDPRVAAALAPAATIVPFTDVLAEGTIEQKQEMLALIATQFRPSFAPTLNAALNDDDPTVRVLAATAAARIERTFLDTSMQLESAWADAPNDGARALALARHYDQFAHTGLLDENRADESRTRALEMYQMASREQPRDTRIAESVIRLLMKLGREDEAIGLFRPVMETEEPSPRLASWYLECLFRRRRFGELRRYSQQLALRAPTDVTMLSDRSLHAMRLWGSEGAAAAPVELRDVVDDFDEDEYLTRDRRRDQVRFEVPYFSPNLP